MRALNIIFILIPLCWVAKAASGAPQWSNMPSKKTKQSIMVSCEGSGPAKDISLRLAIGQCVSMASDQIIGDFHVQSISVQTQKSTGFHEEVSADRHVEGLSCEIQKQEIQIEEGMYRAWILCNFDLSNVKSVPGEKPSVGFRSISSSSRSIIFSTVPQCDSILIRGELGRVVECKSNSMQLLLQPGDEELIVRAKDYLPQHLSIEDLKGVVNVYLERN